MREVASLAATLFLSSPHEDAMDVDFSKNLAICASFERPVKLWDFRPPVREGHSFA